jgi:hypothetical protein
VTTSNRDLEKQKRWQGIVDKQKQSGKSPSQFCKDEGLIDNQFYYWRSIIAKRQKEKKPIQPPEGKPVIPFVPLSIAGNFDFATQQNSAEQIEISKIIVRISANTDKSTLACILQSLG